MNNIIDREKHQYTALKYKDPATGKTRTSLGNRDAVALAMLGLDQDALVKVMKKNGLESKLGKHVGNVNPGQFRMFLGNALRGLIRKGTAVTIGSHEILSLTQEIEVEEPIRKGETPAPSKPAKAEKKVARATRKKAA